MLREIDEIRKIKVEEEKTMQIVELKYKLESQDVVNHGDYNVYLFSKLVLHRITKIISFLEKILR